MGEYSSDLNTELYKYRQPIYITEPTGERQTFIPLKLSLNQNNFNFDLARDDGTDFRLAEGSNGTGVLQMWIAYWNYDERLATIWFKLPEILANEVRTLYAYWGFEYDTGVSDLRYLLGESVEGSIVYTDNLALGVSTSGSTCSRPDCSFDDIYYQGSYPTGYCRTDIANGAWVQANFTEPTKINKLRIAGDGVGFYGNGFQLRASNDNFSSQDDLIFDTSTGQTWTYTEYVFGNTTAYEKYRIVNDKSGYWVVSEIQMMGINEAENVSTPVFRFGDDFNGSVLDVNKWTTSNGSWTIDDSKINLGTDAWIRTGNVLGGQQTTYEGFEYELAPISGLYGLHQSTGHCYLGYTGALYVGLSELIDGDLTSYHSYSYVGNLGGCCLGVDMGTVVDKVKKVRVYFYDSSLSYNGERSFAAGSWISVYKTDTNVAGEQSLVYTFNEEEMPVVRAADYVWYTDLVFDAPGVTARYFHLFGADSLDGGGNLWWSEIKVFADESITTTEPGAFLIEDGVIGVGSPTSTSVPAHRYRCFGGDNVMGIDYYWEGATDRRHDFVNAGTYVVYAGSNKGLIQGAYNQTYFGYYEGTDHCYQGMTNRGGDANPVYSEDLITDPDKAVASSSNPGHPTAWLPRNAADGSQSTQWLAGTISPTWWGYAFDVAQSITRVIIYNGGVSLQAFTIEASNSADAVWNDKTWTSMFYQSYIPTATDFHQMDFSNTAPYKYWRLRYDYDLSQSLVEVEMYKILGYDGEFDYEDSWERKVHRNTEVSNFRIYGEDTSAANGVEIDWVIARDFTPESDPIVNYGDLYVEHEYIGHQQLDSNEYGSDITNIDFHHTSTMGGDPYRMSDDATGSPSTVFFSDTGVTTGSIIIDFGRLKNTITDVNYRHYNSSNTVYFYNASKMSDLDEDVHGRDYWQTTTTSGWAAIMFPTTKIVSSLSFRAKPGSADRMPKNFKFYGSQFNPRFSGWNEKVLIYEGQGRETEEEQAFYFSTGATYYKYYILDVLDTHGGNIAIQEWGMHEHDERIGKRSVSQLRLRPVTFTDNEYYFPKQIELWGSDDGYNWSELLSTTDTPTPFIDYTYGRWSRYSFENYNAYYQYKLVCYDNWRAPVDQMKMSEWEMVERVEEAFNVRVLGGTSNVINNIWADPTTTITDGTMYFTNDQFNTVEYEKLIHYATTTYSGIDDFNVRL